MIFPYMNASEIRIYLGEGARIINSLDIEKYVI